MASSPSFLDAFDALGGVLDAADQVLTLPIVLVDEDPDNPRRVFDNAEIDALAATLRSRGLLQPIVVRPADGQGRYRIRFGARRFRAAQRAGFSEIPAVVRGGDLSEVDSLVEQLVENDQREGLTTAELASAVDRLLEGGLTQADVAERLGRSRPNIAMLAAVKDMPKELKALAPRLGARTLYELNTAWKADAKRTGAYLKERDPRTITQAEARELAGRAPPRRQVRDPSDGSVRAITEPGAAADASALPAATRPPSAKESDAASAVVGAAIFDVEARGLRGVLVLDNVRAPSSAVLVRKADGEVVPVAATDLRVVRVRPG